MKKNTTLITGVSSFFKGAITILLLSALFLSSCSDDDDLPPPTEDITQIVENTEGLDSLFKLLDLKNSSGNPVFANINIELLKSNRTFFAPNNEAFARFVNAVGVNSITELRIDIVRDILNYHIVNSPQALASNQLTGDLETELDDETISANGTTLNEATQPDRTPTVVMADQRATNGIVHVIDNILLPSSITDDISPTFGTLAGFISVIGNLQQMDLLIRKAGLRDELADASAEYTVLGIFDNVLGDVSGLTEEQAQLLASYHIIPGSPFEETILPSEVPTLLTDDPIYVFEDPDLDPQISIQLNYSSILFDNGYSTLDNGKMFVPVALTQSGLSPTFLSSSAFRNTGFEYVQEFSGSDANDDLKLLFQAVNRVPAIKSILEGDDPYTFFAPNDSAFAAANISADSLDMIPVATLEAILMNHIVSGITFSQQLVGNTKATLEGNNIAFTEGNDSIVLTDQSTQKTATIVFRNFLTDVGVIHDVNRLLLLE